MSKTVILVCAHKQDACLKTPPYQPVQVGRAISQTELPFAVGDDTGDNISDRNRHYCELTAHYWAWKNLHDADYIGLNHYRRYFDFEGGSACSLRTVRSEAFFSAPHPVPDFDRLFSRCDIVMARPKIYPYNLYTDYCKCHIESDLLTARQVIAEKYPAYLPDFDRCSSATTASRISTCSSCRASGSRLTRHGCSIFCSRWNGGSRFRTTPCRDA